MKEWFEKFNEKLWLKGDETGEDEARFIKRALHLRKGQSVLDAPCGAGRVSFHLAKSGCVVTGVDLTENYITRASKRFKKENLHGEFHQMDMREIDFHGKFHAVFNWQGSFGYFSNEQNFDALKRFVRAIRRGGRMLIDQPNREYLLRNFIRKRQHGNSTIHNRWYPQTQRVESRRIIHCKGKKQRYSMSIRLYTPRQFKHLFERVGLAVDKMYDNINSEDYTRSSRRLIIVGKKL